MNPEVKELIKDSERLIEKAIESMDVDLRNAAEKAWGATVRATDALILARTGVKPRAMSERRKKLGELIVKEPRIDEVKIWDRFHSRSDVLHGSCFYEGVCEPPEAIKRKIVETREFIEDVKKFIEF
jgi:hypothetical protein